MPNRVADYPQQQIHHRSDGASVLSGFQMPDGKKLLAATEDLILKYPGAALASAAFLGVIVAWWIKRK